MSFVTRHCARDGSERSGESSVWQDLPSSLLLSSHYRVPPRLRRIAYHDAVHVSSVNWCRCRKESCLFPLRNTVQTSKLAFIASNCSRRVIAVIRPFGNVSTTKRIFHILRSAVLIISCYTLMVNLIVNSFRSQCSFVYHRTILTTIWYGVVAVLPLLLSNVYLNILCGNLDEIYSCIRNRNTNENCSISCNWNYFINQEMLLLVFPTHTFSTRMLLFKYIFFFTSTVNVSLGRPPVIKY